MEFRQRQSFLQLLYLFYLQLSLPQEKIVIKQLIQVPPTPRYGYCEWPQTFAWDIQSLNDHMRERPDLSFDQFMRMRHGNHL